MDSSKTKLSSQFQLQKPWKNCDPKLDFIFRVKSLLDFVIELPPQKCKLELSEDTENEDIFPAHFTTVCDSPSVAHKLKCVIKLFLSHMLSCRSSILSTKPKSGEDSSNTIHVRHARKRKIAFVGFTICVLFTAAQLVSTSFTPLSYATRKKADLKIQFSLT